jgi:cysteinyl-tRNA synthetase
MPYLRALSSFRDEIRRLAIAKADPQEILALTDRLRDYEMAELGVALDDQADGRALVKLVPAETLVEAREAKLALAAQKQAEAGAKKEAARRALLDKMAKAKVPAAEFFRPPNVPEGTYSAWDDAGLPTKDAEGADLSKAQAKKLAKAFEAQLKANAAYAKWQAEEDAAAKPSN